MNEIAKNEETPEPSPETGLPKPRRKRTGRKRTVFAPPDRPAPAVRELWSQASLEERERAHRACCLMLEYWLGKKSKQAVAAELGVAPLRVWQLSQQAVSGMLAGLLTQPRRRRSAAQIAATLPEDDPVRLRKEIRELETKLARTEDLVRVLRTAPWASVGAPRPSGPGGPGGAKEERRGRRPRRTRQAKSPAKRRDPRTHRRGPSQPSAQSSGSGDAGDGAGSE